MPETRVTETLFIGGMSCAACFSACEAALRRIDGVESVSVNGATGTAEVVFDPTRAGRTQFAEAIKRAGFRLLSKRPADDDRRPARRRLLIALVLSGLLFVLAMAHMLPGGLFLNDLVAPTVRPVLFCALQLALALPVVWVCRDFYRRGFPALVRLHPTMDSLVALGSGAAFLYSLWQSILVFAGRPEAAQHLYFESAAMILALVSLGKYLEAGARRKTGAAVEKLLKLTPPTALRLTETGEETVAVSAVAVGDRLVCRAGERFAVDGIVESGDSHVDESMLTGESRPVSKGPDGRVSAGTDNLEGRLVYRAARIGADTVLGQIIRLVEHAQTTKPPIAALADRAAAIFVPSVLGIAAVAAVAWTLAGQPFETVLKIVISVLVVACPCALGLATPIAVVVATGSAASAGVLFTSAAALQTLAEADTAVFDKTGTLTAGKPSVTGVFPAPGVDENTLLSLAAAAESGSLHPLGKAIAAEAARRGLTVPEAADFISLNGKGVQARCAAQTVTVGSRRLMEESAVAVADFACPPDAVGGTEVWAAADGRLLGVLLVADALRPETPQVLAQLGKLGLECRMLTGDGLPAARVIARQAGIDPENVDAQVLPDGKAAVITRLKAQGRRTVMIGDGINDAPALAEADTGMAVAEGSDIAIGAADVVLTGGLSGAPEAVRRSRAAIRKIRQNLFWAFFYNALLIPIAAGVLYAIDGKTLLDPMLAAAAMSLSSVSVVLNSLLLYRRKKPKENADEAAHD